MTKNSTVAKLLELPARHATTLESVVATSERHRQPRGLATVFMVEMWERFAFYGMRAVLVLFLVAPAELGGLGLSDQHATAVYGLYTASALLFGLAGGWISDRFVGAQRAVAVGGGLIICGNLLLIWGAYQTLATLCYLGLLIDATGVGFLKPNANVIVAELYPESGARRDAGFSIFYVGINVGALLGSLAIPFLAARYGWWSGFVATVVGMSFGLMQYFVSRRLLGSAGLRRQIASRSRGSPMSWLWIASAIVVLALITLTLRDVSIDLVQLSHAATMFMSAVLVGYFIYLVTRPDLTSSARKRLLVMVPLCVAYLVYIAGYQQGGSSLSLFVQRYTNRSIAGLDVPAGAFQAAIPFFTIILAPVFAGIWLRLGHRRRDPSASNKFAFALVVLGLGFLVMSVAAHLAASQGVVAPTWIIGTFLLHTISDLCIAPIGLSATSKLAPTGRLGQTMGLWFVAGAVGNSLAGVVAGELKLTDADAISAGFFNIFLVGSLAGVALFALSPFIAKLTRRLT